MVSDPDTRRANGDTLDITFAYQWSVPKVSRPLIDNDNHWVAASDTSQETDGSYTPTTDNVGSVLRLQVTYTDTTDVERTLNILTEYPVRAVPLDDNDAPANDAPVFPATGVYTRTIAENSDKGTSLGAPVTATDVNGDVLYYTIPATSDANPFAIDKITGQITVDGSVHFLSLIHISEPTRPY